MRHLPKGLTNEDRLLLFCARKVLRPESLAETHSLIAAGIDWDLLDHRAEQHGLSQLVHWHLHRQSLLTADADSERTQRQRFENNVHNLQLSAALLKTLEALHGAGIRALAYKGPALAALLYGDIGLREMSDLDILIDRPSFLAAREVLDGLGYQPQFQHSCRQEKARLRSDCECEFSDSDGKVTLDLHWQITVPHLAQRFRFDELWQRRRVVTLGQKSIPTFSVEDTVLVLAVHGGKHLWQRLSWLADFAESLCQNLDWQVLRLRARDARAERMLLLALALAEDVIQVQLPSEFAAAIRDDDIVQTVAASIAGKLFEDRNGAEQSANRWLTLLQLADSRWDGMRSAAHFALGSGPHEWQAVRLPDSLFAFYPLLRIARLLRMAPSLFSRAAARTETRGRMQNN